MDGQEVNNMPHNAHRCKKQQQNSGVFFKADTE